MEFSSYVPPPRETVSGGNHQYRCIDWILCFPHSPLFEVFAFFEDVNKLAYPLGLSLWPLDPHESEQEWELFCPSQFFPE